MLSLTFLAYMVSTRIIADALGTGVLPSVVSATGVRGRAWLPTRVTTRERTVSPISWLLRSSSKRRGAAAALGLLCSTACGGESDSETPDCSSCTDAIDPATLDCNAPLPEEVIAAVAGPSEPPPPVLDAGGLESMEIAMLGTQAGHGLLAIDPQVYPYKVFVPEHCVPLGEELITQVRICVDAVGNVSGVRILRYSLPIIDSQLPDVIARWRFNLYIVDGRATPFCYPLNYRVR